MRVQRMVGQDHEHYMWSPIVSRPVLRWPGNARVAVCVIVNLDHFDWYMPPDAPTPVGGMHGPCVVALSAHEFPDITSFGQREYGLRCGVFRLFSVLDKYGIKPTIAMDSTIAENYPFLVNECRRRDLEFIAHGISDRQIIHASMSEEDERQYIRESIQALTRATGTAPVGWSGPHFEETARTPQLLAEEGILYLCDWGNDEQPYRMNVKQGELYSLGIPSHLDDVWCHLRNWRRIDEYERMLTDAFDCLYAEGTATGRMMVLNLHPWVMGQPWRIKYLENALDHIHRYANVWYASGREIVDAYKTQTI